jgi:uncharacterized LabA/DUF88 family protein
MASDDLRRQADSFVDLADLSNIIGRPRQTPPPRFVQDEAAGPDQDGDDGDDF